MYIRCIGVNLIKTKSRDICSAKLSTISRIEFVKRAEQRQTEPLSVEKTDPNRIPLFVNSVKRLEQNNKNAVLICLAKTPAQGPSLILTKRTKKMRNNPGDISLPGGKVESNESPCEAVLRETQEEIGIPPADISIWTSIRPIPTRSRDSSVIPFVGILHSWENSAKAIHLSQNDEVDTVFIVPVDQLLARIHFTTFRINRFNPDDGFPLYYTLPIFNPTDYLSICDGMQEKVKQSPLCIWGLTATMIYEVLFLLGAPLEDKIL
jgi:8-oxo-dGTP pyrophosphatase MutT (NUDIX family)